MIEARRAPARSGFVGRIAGLHPDRLRELSLLLLIALTVLVFSFLIEGYFSGRFFNRVSTGVAIIAVLAMAQTIVILTRNIDLSVGSVVGISAYLTAELLVGFTALPAPLAVVVGVGIGSVLGAVNGVLVAYGRVPSIVVTLGTLAIYRSWLIDHGGAKTITADTLPDWVVTFPQATVVTMGDLDLRLVVLIAIVVIVALQIVFSRLRVARYLYAAGSNPAAAARSGLPTRRITLSAFVASGALAGLAGFMFVARFGTVTPVTGTGLELQSVAAAVVGGVSTLGGSGTILGAVLGAVLIETLGASLIRMPAVSEFWRDAVLGILILLAIAADFLVRRRLGQLRGSSAVPTATTAAQGVPDSA
jgi:rhamnose transport system permease protein